MRSTAPAIEAPDGPLPSAPLEEQFPVTQLPGLASQLLKAGFQLRRSNRCGYTLAHDNLSDNR